MKNNKTNPQLVHYYFNKYYLFFCIGLSVLIGHLYKLDLFIRFIPFLKDETFYSIVFYCVSSLNIVVALNFIIIPNLYKNYANTYWRNLILSTIVLTTAYIIVLFINIIVHEIFLPKALSIILYTVFLYLFHIINFTLSYIIYKISFKNILYIIVILFNFFSYLLYLSNDFFIKKILSSINLVNYEIDTLVLLWENKFILPTVYYVFFTCYLVLLFFIAIILTRKK